MVDNGTQGKGYRARKRDFEAATMGGSSKNCEKKPLGAYDDIHIQAAHGPDLIVTERVP